MTKIKKITLIHIFGQTPHHYLPMKAFFSSINSAEVFSQVYWAWQHEQQDCLTEFDYYSDSAHLLAKMQNESSDTRFVFHGMFDRHLWAKLLFSRLPKRCAWVCWGAELYGHFQAKVTIRRNVANMLHKLLIRRFNKVYALNAGDAALLETVYAKVSAEVLPYPLIGLSFPPSKQTGTKLNILVGNSATQSNNHKEIFDWLAHFSQENIIIHAPLNYGGSAEYVKGVIDYGVELFGAKFRPITSMLAKHEYDELLASMDLTIFAQTRQQGLYVVYTMLKNGKKIFLRENTTSFKDLTNSGFSVYASEAISSLSFAELHSHAVVDADKNKTLMVQTFSEDALRPIWKKSLLAHLNTAKLQIPNK